MSKAQMALVTGGGTRVGRAIVEALVRAQFDVAIHCNRSSNSAGEIARWADTLGRRCEVFASDLTRPRAAGKLVAEGLEFLGGLDLLVNNAALFYDDSARMVELARMKILNVDVPAECMTGTAAALEMSGGCVVNIADAAYSVPIRSYKAYSRSQRALTDFTVEQARVLAPRGVRVNAVCPGTVLPAADLSADRVQSIVAKIPMGRLGSPEDVADAVLFLSRSRFVTGQLLAVDGGRSLCKEDAPHGADI